MEFDPGSTPPALPDLLLRLDRLLSRLRDRPDFAAPAGAATEAVADCEADAALLRILERSGMTISSHGRVALAPPDQAGLVAGFDLGGTKLRGALADVAGGLWCEIEEPTAHDREGAALDQIVLMTHRLLDRCGVAWTALRRCVVGVPGAVAPSGAVSLSPNLRIPSEISVANLLRKRLGVDAVVENDVNLAAFGEAWRGRGLGGGSLAFLAFGTGVGAGLVLGGDLVRGAFGSAGEVAFLPVGADPFAQAAASANGVYEDLVSSASVRAHHGGSRSVRDIFEAADAGDERARASVDRLARDAALAVATIGALIDPAMIVLGGGIGARIGFVDLVAPLARSLAPFGADIEASGLGPRAGVVGALMLALDGTRRRCLEAGFHRHLAGVAA